MGMTSASSLSTTELEEFYDQLARAIDSAGERKAPLFLVKLALLNANALANPELLRTHVAEALKDL